MTAALHEPAVAEHLEQTVRAWLGVAADVAVPALPDRLARRLLRLEERERAHRDQWGCWEFGFNESFRDGTLLVPEIDQWVAARRTELAAAGHTVEPLWPDGRRFAVCLTHDVDLVSYASTPRQAIRFMRAGLAVGTPADRLVRFARPPVRAARTLRKGVSLTPVAEELELIVGIEREYGVPASYFFTVFPESPSRYDCVYRPGDACRFRGTRTTVANVMNTLAAEGFDVGLHGSYHSALEPGRLASERAVLERATGLDIRTTRQHFIHFDVSVTPRLQAEAGLTADSSLGFNRSVGFRAATSLPFRMFDFDRGRPFDLLQLPIVLHDGALLRADALELDVELARETIRVLVDAIADAGGVATVVFHPNNLARDEFRDLFGFVIEHAQSRDAWFGSVRDIERWWRSRSR